MVSTIGLSKISTFGFISIFSEFEIFSFAIVSLFIILYQQLTFRHFDLRICFCVFDICIIFFCSCFFLFNMVSTIDVSAISTFEFVFVFETFGFFSFTIISLYNMI